MSTEKNNWVNAITKLTKLTQDGNLTWTAHQPPSSFSKGPNSRVQTVFLTNYGDRRLRLYENRSQEEVIDFDEFEMRPIAKLVWTKNVVLEFVDNDDNSLWAFPYVEALNDLLAAVQYQVAGVKDFLADLLAAS